MHSKQEPDPRAYDKLVTFYGDGCFKIIYPIELKYLNEDQEALRELVRYYENRASEASD